jgi:hypothetical protein
MQWTMPHRVLQIVASLIGLAAAISFALGVVNAPQRGAHLPGEKLGGPAGSAAAIDAADATPLGDERIEGPPQPTPEELAKAKADEEAKKAQAEADAGNSDDDDEAALGNTAPPPLLRPIPPVARPNVDQTLGGPPAADEPPH